MRARYLPSTTTRTASPCALRICLTLATTPTVYRSSLPGSSTRLFFWVTRKIFWLPFIAWLSARMDFWRATSKCSTIFGNMTSPRIAMAGMRRACISVTWICSWVISITFPFPREKRFTITLRQGKAAVVSAAPSQSGAQLKVHYITKERPCKAADVPFA